MSTPAGWPTVTPEEAGWDAEALAGLTTWLGDHGTTRFVALDRGRIVAEHHWQGADPSTVSDVYSVQKSVVSAMVSALVARELLDLDEPASTWLGTGWTATDPDQEAAILLRHLLTMTSGLYDDFGFEAPPGTVWYYNNNAYHQVRRIIETVTGATGRAAFADLLFDPVGMPSARWEDREGVTDPTGRPLAGLLLTARDLAAFGRFVLDGGRRGGVDVIGDGGELLAAATSPSQELNPSYGRLWWLLDQPSAIVPGPDRDGTTPPRKAFGGRSVDHPLAPSAPAGTAAAMGAFDQRLYVVPSHGVVIVRLGAAVAETTAAAGNIDEQLWRLLAPSLPQENPRS